MGVSLENLFSTSQTVSNTQTGGTAQSVQSDANQILQSIYGNGDVISGKVLSMQGNAVELLLPNGQNLSAVLGENVHLNIGEQMIFAIKNMNANQIELNPLYMNTANTNTIMKALEGANMSINEQNVSMVQNMMERGMSIQKDALLSMKRTMMQNPSAPVEDVVTLKSLGISVNENSLTQLTAYKNSENQLMRPIMDMLTKVPETFDTLLEGGDTGKAVSLYRDLVELFSEVPQGMSEKSGIMGENGQLNTNMTETPAKVETAQGGQNTPSVAVEVKVANDVILSGDDVLGLSDLKQMLAKVGMSEGQIDSLLGQNPNKQELLQAIHRQITGNDGLAEDTLAKLFQDNTFKSLMDAAGKEFATLSPKETAEYDNIEKLYEQLQKKADKILETLSGREDLSLAKSAQNLKANMDFLNQINQMFQYVQLPLKFQENYGNGELFVYGNKKKLSLEDGDVSALLHLDMEHLGTVDIHVEMNREKQVKTNFYFADESMLDFIYEHIDELNDRLIMRGYGPVTAVHKQSEDAKTPAMEMFEVKKSETPVAMKNQSFDARI